MKLRHTVAIFTVCWLGIMTHCLWPPGYHRGGEIAIVGALVVIGGFVSAMVGSVERENAQRRLQNSRRRIHSPNAGGQQPASAARPRHLHSVASEQSDQINTAPTYSGNPVSYPSPLRPLTAVPGRPKTPPSLSGTGDQ